jgi:adenylate kinase
VIEIDVPDEEIVQRLSGRRQHPASGRVYHIVYNPPKVEGKDDETGEDLVQRPDDQEATIRKRLGSYHTETEQLVGFYQGRAASGENAPTYDKLNGLRPIDEVQTDLFAILDQAK